jgi:hypothetical protein
MAATASRKTAALEAFGVDAARLGRIARGHDEGRQILQQDGAHAVMLWAPMRTN